MHARLLGILAALHLTTASLFAAATYPLSSVRYEGRPTAFQIATLSDGNEFLVIFDRHATRISASGEMLDPVSRVAQLPASGWNVAGVWTGDAYLIAQAKYGYDEYSIATQRLDRSGKALGESYTIDDALTPVAIVRIGSNFLLLTLNSKLRAHLLSASGELLRTGVLPDDSTATNVAATSIDAGALIVTYETKVGIRARVVDATGTILRDYVVSTLTDYGSNVSLVGTPSGALAVWKDQQALMVATIDNEGRVTAVSKVLDPPPGLEIRGFVRIAGGALLGGISRSASYEFGTMELTFDGVTKRAWVPMHDSFITLASNGQKAITIQDSQRGLTARVVNDDGSMAPAHDFPPLPSTQTAPQIACGTEDCVVVWSEENRDGTYSIRANALDRNGVPIGPDAVDVSNGPGYDPAIARSADQYLVTWRDTDAGYTLTARLFGRRLHVRAEPIDPAPFLIDAEASLIQAVASDGRDFLVLLKTV